MRPNKRARHDAGCSVGRSFAVSWSTTLTDSCVCFVVMAIMLLRET